MTRGVEHSSTVVYVLLLIPIGEYDKVHRKFYHHLQQVEFKWFEIGVLLGVPVHVLKIIEQHQQRIVEVIKVSELLLLTYYS